MRSTGLGLIVTPFKEVLVGGWDASHCPYLADRLGWCRSFAVVCRRPYHSTGAFREDRTGQSSIARSKRTQDPGCVVGEPEWGGRS